MPVGGGSRGTELERRRWGGWLLLGLLVAAAWLMVGVALWPFLGTR